jgi:hypothetical protein
VTGTAILTQIHPRPHLLPLLLAGPGQERQRRSLAH